VNPVTRRQFVKSLGAASLAFPFIGCRHVSNPPSGILRHASFGASGMAWADIKAICSNPFVKLVAVADVDLNRVGPVKEAFPDVRIYQDWRELLDKEGNQLDSVNVSTPDHLHAPIALSAMQLGKHCYCQKPLAHNLHETRVLTRYAREKKLVTQMGIQIHSEQVYRQAVALLQSGVIGKIKEVHTWSNKKWGDTGAPPAPAPAVPENLAWDLWLGPAAQRPYVGNGYYHPGNWRKRLDFGTGTFGDMGCHIFDPVFEGLALTAPLSLRSEGPAPDAWNWSINAQIRYVFPGTRFTADSTLPITWYDGDARPPADLLAMITPPELAEPAPDGPITNATQQQAARQRALARRIPLDQGSIFLGTQGVLHLPHIGTPRLLPADKFKDHPLPEVAGSHHWSDWAEACVGKPTKPLAPFDYSGPLTEAVLLGSVAVRFPQTTLQWNSEALRFENEPAANAFVRRDYRDGWRVAGL
jgi:hypothetical protein